MAKYLTHIPKIKGLYPLLAMGQRRGLKSFYNICLAVEAQWRNT